MTDPQPIELLYMGADSWLASRLETDLESRGILVQVAGDGETGLAMADEGDYDVLLVEHNLAGRCCGLGVIRTLAARACAPPAILIAGNGNEKVAVEAMNLGATDYLLKDVGLVYLELLPIIIERALEKQRLIIKRKQTGETLQERKKQDTRLYREFQSLLNGISETISLLDPDMKVLWTNKGAAESLKREIRPQPKAHCFRVWENRSAPCDNCPAVECFRTGKVAEALITRVDDSIWGVKAFPLKNKNGDVIKVSVLANDITEKFRLREEAARASRLASLGQLAAGVAHEINNPNSLILLNAPILKEVCADAATLLEDRFRENGDFMLGRLKYSRMRELMPSLVSEILDGAKRIKRIVDDLKDFVRQEDTASLEAIDFNDTVQTAVRLVGNTIKNSTNNFVSAYGDNLPMPRGNPQQIEQVVVNLIMNACQALSDKDKGIFLSTYFDEIKEMSILVVRDEGIGIPQEKLPHITEPFFTTKRKTGGTGLGLSISARIVKMHDGNLDFSSKTDEGTTVTLALPIFKGVKTQ